MKKWPLAMHPTNFKAKIYFVEWYIWHSILRKIVGRSVRSNFKRTKGVALTLIFNVVNNCLFHANFDIFSTSCCSQSGREEIAVAIIHNNKGPRMTVECSNEKRQEKSFKKGQTLLLFREWVLKIKEQLRTFFRPPFFLFLVANSKNGMPPRCCRRC
jgi:hypothetical protein